MSYFPIFLNVEEKSILVVGAGNIALEKLEKLVQFTKNITVIAPEAKYNTYTLIKEHCITYYQRKYHIGDIDSFDIVIVATDDINLQESIYLESRGKHILVNSVDNEKFCDFIFPSFVKKGDLTVAISTNGSSPAFAKAFRKYLNSIIPDNIDEFLRKLKKLRSTMPKGKERMEYFKNLVDDYFAKNFN